MRFDLSPAQIGLLVNCAWIAGAIVAGVAIQRLLFFLIQRWTRAHESALINAVVSNVARPAAYIIPLVLVLAIFNNLDLPRASIIRHIAGLCVIAAFAWAFIVAIRIVSDFSRIRHRVDIEDNLAARQLETRLDILARSGITLTVILAAGVMLMTFPSIRALGTTVLASAGFAGIVVGIAARPFFENLIAGIQLAFTQPVRIDDVVIVEKQFGRIEEIHSTYIVVRLWDLRRMVVPLTYFINTPFENWTRRSANLMGAVNVYTDWTLDVEEVRAALPGILARTPLWDKAFFNVQVNDASENAMQVRVLVTARDSGTLSDLQAFVREAVIAHIRDHQPDAFPRRRIDSLGEPARPQALQTADRRG